MSLVQPLALLLLIPALGALAWIKYGRGAALLGLPGDWHFAIDKTLRSFMAQRILLGAASPIVWLGAIWVLAVLALARPTYEVDEPANYSNLAGRVIALDLGAGADIHGQRLAVSKLLDQSPGVPTALVVATADAFDAVPLTTDRAYIERYLGVIKPDVMPVGGRSLYVAMAHSEGVLTRAGVVVGQVVLVSGNLPAELQLESAGRWRRAIIVPAQAQSQWVELAESIEAELASNTEVDAVVEQFARAMDEVERNDRKRHIDLRPWFVGTAAMAWLAFFRRRRSE